MQREPGTHILNLGQTTATGNDAFGQAIAFKRFMREMIGHGPHKREPSGAYIHFAEAPGKRFDVQVVYSPEIAGAEAWAREASDQAELVWEGVRTGRVPKRGRVA